ncbi:MAG: prepilin-type N-terminal cleavage/methylation domain-containing protein [Phycisphaerae bacterium]
MKRPTSPSPKKHPAFTLVEMLVVLLIITILIGIGLAVGTQVENSSEANLTRTELKNLQAALTWYTHKSGGQVPSSMKQFLEDYQLDHATPGPSGTWKQTPDVLTALPPNLVVSGPFAGPGGSGTMTGVIYVLDGFGNPIQYMPPAPYIPQLTFAPSKSIVVNNSTFQNGNWQPSQQHAPYFYSFGPLFSSAQTNTSSTSTFGPADYIYSYNQ